MGTPPTCIRTDAYESGVSSAVCMYGGPLLGWNYTITTLHGLKYMLDSEF